MPFPPLFLGECLGNSECGPQQACQDYRCVDPCQTGACGQGAECEVRNHVAICRCPRGMTGDPHEVRELREAEIKKTLIYFNWVQCVSLSWGIKTCICVQSVTYKRHLVLFFLAHKTAFQRIF